MGVKSSINTTLDCDLLVRARRAAATRNISVSALLERALDRYLELLQEENVRDDAGQQREDSRE
jgi:post-segregation antitoxin (ccd killing protein)